MDRFNRIDEIVNSTLDNRINDFKYFNGLTAEQLDKLVQENLLDLDDRQNNGPTIRDFYLFSLQQNPEVTFGGYIVYPPRKDARLTITTIEQTHSISDADSATFDEFVLKFDPDEYINNPEEGLYAWWD